MEMALAQTYDGVMTSVKAVIKSTRLSYTETLKNPKLIRTTTLKRHAIPRKTHHQVPPSMQYTVQFLEPLSQIKGPCEIRI